MTNLEAKNNFENEVLNNVTQIIRESRHSGLNNWGERNLNEISNFLLVANINLFFVNDVNEFLHKTMLDLMDKLKFEIIPTAKEHAETAPNTYKTIVSVYDVIKEWYFEN